MKALPYTAGLLAVLVIGGYLFWAAFTTARERHLRRARIGAKWSHFCRPTSEGNWEVGVHRVSDDDRVFDEIVMDRLPGDVTATDRAEAEGKAILRAGQFNEATL